jgi:hypothetical protein
LSFGNTDWLTCRFSVTHLAPPEDAGGRETALSTGRKRYHGDERPPAGVTARLRSRPSTDADPPVAALTRRVLNLRIGLFTVAESGHARGLSEGV